jgi:hypothetical protein
MKKITLLTAAIGFAVVMAFLKGRSGRKAAVDNPEVPHRT